MKIALQFFFLGPWGGGGGLQPYPVPPVSVHDHVQIFDNRTLGLLGGSVGVDLCGRVEDFIGLRFFNF